MFAAFLAVGLLPLHEMVRKLLQLEGSMNVEAVA